MSLHQEELDEFLASIDLVPGMIADNNPVAPQEVPPLDAGETDPAERSTATSAPGHGPHQQVSDASRSLPPSPRNPSPSAKATSPRVQLPDIVGSRTGSGSVPTRSSGPHPDPHRDPMSSAEAPTDIDALTASLESEGIIPAESNSQSVGDGKFTALPPLLSTSPKSHSMSTVMFEVDASAQEHRQHHGGVTIIQRESTELHIRSIDSSRASSSQSPQGTLSPRGVTPLSKTISPSRRRLTIGSHEISPHALERLGVNTDILKKEKGMKKLGISDVDIQRSEEIRRYSGVPQDLSPVTKVEFMFGFTKEQLLRVKAINRLGTSEEEVMDEYSRRVSRLGEVHDTATAVHSK